ncbi:MAG TPA: hypothetical protein VMJ10_09315, partial [Kofleriaceae bacterium]|nr:hypothetical protein [Kofleriaceae bacterium]
MNPWRLQAWLGHKRIDETMLYVHVAESHAREWPDPVKEAASRELDPDKRILAMLGARVRGSHDYVVAVVSSADLSRPVRRFFKEH